jgi:hypothetical protein
MKKISILFAFVAATMFASAQQVATQPAEPDPNAAAIEFTETLHDFGNVQAGDKVTCTFEFTNTGKTALVVTKAQPGCGCTVSEWTKTPVEPGQTGTVTATYTAGQNPSTFTKSITVYSNAGNAQQGKTFLSIKGVIVAKATAPLAENKSQIAQ